MGIYQSYSNMDVARGRITHSGLQFEVCHLFRELQETYQLSGLLAKCQFGVLQSII